MPNALTRTAGLKFGPVVFETVLKHYFDRVKKENAEDGVTQLRQDELLYDAGFNIVKRFLDVATHYSVEELQAFSNSRTPSPPWVHSVQVIVPISCCDEAAALVIQALGGEEHTARLVGGTKWWQVRGVSGVTGEWVIARKDWQEAEKRRKAFEQKKGANSDPLPAQNGVGDLPSSSSVPSSGYDEGMDEMRCVLHVHGGGYYFGSIDQERYYIQRYARKIRGRVLAVNYRLAPQYPFPCALQDLVAAYLYLIKPPPEAPHQPVKPAHIVVAGDSAGGGLTLALLQVLRDTGQPQPAGAVLISPWCDLTHSFPSIHINTATDVLPVYGLSLHKPSVLWPPPSEEMTQKVHRGLRRRIREIVRVTIKGHDPCEAASHQSVTRDAPAGSRLSGDDGKSVSSDMPIDVGTTVSLPSVDEKEHQTISLEAKSGERLRIESQLQLYTQNSLLGHPLVSPAQSYLGGLPPLLVIASDKEVLRDEVIYSAHKAADPSRFPLKDEARALYPPLVGIEERYCPTHVHLQVYDDTAHVLPVLFPFSTPGKYCYRAIATFTKHVTGMLNPMKPSSSSDLITLSPKSLPSTPMSGDFLSTPQFPRSASTTDLTSSPRGGLPIAAVSSLSIPESPRARALSSFTRPTFSFRMKSLQASMAKSSSEKTLAQGRSSTLHSQADQDVGGPAKLRRSVSMPDTSRVHYAGEPSVYYDEQGLPSWKGGMIRERISTQGIIRPLEPTEQLDAMQVPPAIIGVLSERAVRRYLEGKSLFDKKYAKEILAIEKERSRNVDLAKKDVTKTLTHLKDVQNGKAKGKAKGTAPAPKDGIESPIETWGWALADERPPPSSIVARRDTPEARRLVRIADLSALQDETHMSGNNLWAVIMNFLTTTPGKEEATSHPEPAKPAPKTGGVRKSKSVFASLRQRRKEAEEQQ